MKKVIILNHNGGRLANQLWNFISIYAYCLERGYICENNCFFEYSRYFNASALNPNVSTRLFSEVYKLCLRLIPEKIVRKIFRKFYNIYVITRSKANTLNSERPGAKPEDFYYLPPSQLADEQLLGLEVGNLPIYLSGWRFRNPIGLQKFYSQVIDVIQPKAHNHIKDFVNSLRQPETFLVGVHIRHGDYKTWNGGKYYFQFSEVRQILDDFLKHYPLADNQKVLFLICSDDVIPEEVFKGLNYHVGLGSEITDLFSLASTDLIIGSNSTYGPLAAYCGQIPFYTFSRETIDWKKSVDIFLI